MLELESIWANIWEGRESCKGSVWGKWRKTRPHKCTVELMSMNLNPRTDWNRTVLPQTLMIWMSHMCSKCHCHGAKHTPNPAVGGTKGESRERGEALASGCPSLKRRPADKQPQVGATRAPASGTALVVQWFRVPTRSTRDMGSPSSMELRSCMPRSRAKNKKTKHLPWPSRVKIKCLCASKRTPKETFFKWLLLHFCLQISCENLPCAPFSPRTDQEEIWENLV